MCVPAAVMQNEEGDLVSLEKSNVKTETKFPSNDNVETTVAPRKLQHKDKLIKAKERYMKIHEEIVERDNQIAAQLVSDNNNDDSEIRTDMLALSTVQCHNIIRLLTSCSEKFRRSKFHRILFTTTQPAHIIMIVAVLCVSSALVSSPKNIRGTSQNPHSRMTAFIYLATFVMHFGAQIFMTFVSGLSLYFALPRHAFGEVQRVLFPRYFTINASLSFVTLFIFVKHHPMHTWDREITIQIGGMSCAFFLELLIRLYMTPSLLSLMTAKMSIERAAGVGNEIACHNPGSLKHCPHYVKIYNAFRRVHSIIAMGNIITMACTTLHLHYIASNMCVL